MELFYSSNISNGKAFLDSTESIHCTRVLRHSLGDTIHLTDGKGSIYRAKLLKIDKRGSELEIVSKAEGEDKRAYTLHMAVALTKNSQRFEWFLEKGVEIGVDRITPLICKNSERKNFNLERGEKIVLSAMKQSLKSHLPMLDAPISAIEFIEASRDQKLHPSTKLIGHCGDGKRESIKKLLKSEESNHYIVMIGPEGDFSLEEIEMALKSGYSPFHLGSSRFRVESAAITVVSALYLHYLDSI